MMSLTDNELHIIRYFASTGANRELAVVVVAYDAR